MAEWFPYRGPVLERFEFEAPQRVTRYNDFFDRWRYKKVKVLVSYSGLHLLVVPRRSYDAWRRRNEQSRSEQP